MEQHIELQQEASRRLKLAHHMLTQTYPLVKDPKLLLGVTENILRSLECGMTALLYLERFKRQIPVFNNNFEEKLKIFRYNVIDKYSINREHLLLIQDINNIMITHKRSPVEFSRKDRFIICTDNYRMQEITVDRLKRYIERTRDFLVVTNRMVSKDGRII